MTPEEGQSERKDAVRMGCEAQQKALDFDDELYHTRLYKDLDAIVMHRQERLIAYLNTWMQHQERVVQSLATGSLLKPTTFGDAQAHREARDRREMQGERVAASILRKSAERQTMRTTTRSTTRSTIRRSSAKKTSTVDRTTVANPSEIPSERCGSVAETDRSSMATDTRLSDAAYQFAHVPSSTVRTMQSKMQNLKTSLKPKLTFRTSQRRSSGAETEDEYDFESADQRKQRRVMDYAVSTRTSDLHLQDGWQHRRRTLREGAAAVVSHTYFQVFIGLLILSDAALVGAETEEAARNEGHAGKAWHAVRVVYATGFALEVCLRMFAESWSFFSSDAWGWNVFDLGIVVISVVELVLEKVAPEWQKTAGQLNQFRVLRVARTARIFRVFRIMRFFRSLRLLVYSILNSLRSLCWTMVLLSVFLYLFGCLFTQATYTHLRDTGAYENLSRPELQPLLEWYGSLGKSIFTLFKAVTGGVSWEDVVKPLASVNWTWVALFILFIAFVQIAVLNVVTGVFCQTALEGAENEREMLVEAEMSSKEAHVKELRLLFADIDVDDSGSVTLEEFQASLGDERVVAFFASMELSVEDAWHLFKLLDIDESNSVDIEEFVSGCLRLKGKPRNVDIAMLMYENRWMASTFTRLMKREHEQRQNLHTLIKDLVGSGERLDSAVDACLPLFQFRSPSEVNGLRPGSVDLAEDLERAYWTQASVGLGSVAEEVYEVDEDAPAVEAVGATDAEPVGPVPWLMPPAHALIL